MNKLYCYCPNCHELGHYPILEHKPGRIKVIQCYNCGQTCESPFPPDPLPPDEPDDDDDE